MTKPVRLQLSRKKGFNLQRLSAETNGLPVVKVARPTKWGNPFKVGTTEEGVYIDTATEAVTMFEDMLSDPQLRAYYGYPSDDEIMRELRGKNLCCFCGPESDCHANSLLRIANS